MNLLFSCIGRRLYIAEWFMEQFAPGDRLVVTSGTSHTSGFGSCDLVALMPDVQSDEYIPAMLELCRRESIDALLSFLDVNVVRLAHHREEFQALGVLPVVPDPSIAEMCLDKVAAARFLADEGIASPMTYQGLEEASRAIECGDLSYPIMVKPRRGRGSLNTMTARNRLELEAYMTLEPEMIAQNRLSGQEYGIDVLNDLNGQVISVIVKQKIRMVAGSTAQAVTVHHQAALDAGVHLGRLLGQLGPLDVDAFVDGENVTILEMNPRFGGGYPFSHLAGADFPRKILAMLRNEPVAPDVGKYEVGIEGTAGVRFVGPFPGPIADMRHAAP